MANLVLLNMTVTERFVGGGGSGDILYASSSGSSESSLDDVMEAVRGWPLMSSAYPTFILTGIYFWFVVFSGPEFMKHRKPFQLRSALIWYNAFQVALSAYIFVEMGLSGWFTHYDYKCQPLETGPAGLRMASVCWVYFISKFTEFFDTVFFVLRKKDNQISGLHLFHHSIMPLNSWIGLHLAPGGHGCFFALLNSFVHIVMYGYYMIAALGPKYQKYVWWKKHLTKLQLIQFCAVFLHEIQLLIQPSCEYPRSSTGMTLTFAVVFLALFSNFYVQSYRKNAAAKAKAVKLEMDEEKVKTS